MEKPTGGQRHVEEHQGVTEVPLVVLTASQEGAGHLVTLPLGVEGGEVGEVHQDPTLSFM